MFHRGREARHCGCACEGVNGSLRCNEMGLVRVARNRRKIVLLKGKTENKRTRWERDEKEEEEEFMKFRRMRAIWNVH